MSLRSPLAEIATMLLRPLLQMTLEAIHVDMIFKRENLGIFIWEGCVVQGSPVFRVLHRHGISAWGREGACVFPQYTGPALVIQKY